MKGFVNWLGALAIGILVIAINDIVSPHAAICVLGVMCGLLFMEKKDKEE